MQKALKMLMIVGSLVLGTAYADTAGLDYTSKNSSNRYQDNVVVGLTVDHTITDGLAKGVTAAVRIEDEMVDTTVTCRSRHGNCQTSVKNQEGLVQIGASRDVLTRSVFELPVTLYGNVDVGYKSQNAQSGFKFYAGSVGLKTTISNVRLNVAERLRSPFDEGSVGTGSKFRTYETSVGAAIDISKKNVAFVKYADERGDRKNHSLGF